MTPAAILMIFALAWELVAGGALHNMDPRVFRAAYQATWWMPGVLLCCASTLSVIVGEGWLQRAISFTALSAAIGSFAFYYPYQERRKFADAVRARRTTDSRRRQRAPFLVLSAALIVVAALVPNA